MPKGSDCHRAAGSLCSSGASEASSDEKPVKCVSRQRTWEGSGSKKMGEHLLSKMGAMQKP